MAQTRDFYFASRQAALVVGSGYRAALWEATLDAYGARELNARFDSWGRPMIPAARVRLWRSKIAFEASMPARPMASLAAISPASGAVRCRWGIGMMTFGLGIISASPVAPFP